MKYPNRIREIREEKNMSGTKVAETLNISPQYYYDLEKGKRGLSADLAQKMATIYGVSVDYLLGRVDVRNHEKEKKAETQQDERDVEQEINKIMDDLKHDGAIMFNHEPIDDEDRRLLRKALEFGLEVVKEKDQKKNKNKDN